MWITHSSVYTWWSMTEQQYSGYNKGHNNFRWKQQVCETINRRSERFIQKEGVRGTYAYSFFIILFIVKTLLFTKIFKSYSGCVSSNVPTWVEFY